MCWSQWSSEFIVCNAKGMIAPSFGSNLVMRRDLMKVQTVILMLIKGVSRNYYNLVISNISLDVYPRRDITQVKKKKWNRKVETCKC